MKKRKLAGGTPSSGDVISAKGINLDMQSAEATYDGIALEEYVSAKERGAVAACKQDDIDDIKIEERQAAAEIDSVGKYEPRLTENGIPADVLAKLLPGDDILELTEPKVAGGLGYRFVKRAFDVVSCGCALVVLAIPMAIIAAKIRLESSGPVIYSQRRVGKDGKIFNVYKFRSMYIDAEVRGAQWAIGDDPRVTPFGKFMREKRIDEIPQFWNIVKGDMSLIGPRPERPAFCQEFEKRIHGWDYRTLVRPGLSGLAQVTGGYDLLPKEKVVLDLLREIEVFAPYPYLLCDVRHVPPFIRRLIRRQHSTSI